MQCLISVEDNIVICQKVETGELHDDLHVIHLHGHSELAALTATPPILQTVKALRLNVATCTS